MGWKNLIRVVQSVNLQATINGFAYQSSSWGSVGK